MMLNPRLPGLYVATPLSHIMQYFAHCSCAVCLANNLNPDQPDKLICIKTALVFLKQFVKKIILKKKQKHQHPICTVLQQMCLGESSKFAKS